MTQTENYNNYVFDCNFYTNKAKESYKVVQSRTKNFLQSETLHDSLALFV